MTPCLTIIISLISGGLGAFIGSYLGQKAKNLATKEDVAEITRKQEEIKTELANHSHFSRVRYDREIEVYQKVWPKLMDLSQATSFSEDISEITPQNRYAAAGDDIKRVIRENLPFFAKEIRNEILSFQALCINHRMYDTLSRRRDLTPEEITNFSGSHEKIKVQLDKVEEAI